MQLKHLLSLAALSGVAADNLGEHDAAHQSRKLQLPASVTCLSTGGSLATCCPEGDLSDGVCVLLACVNLDDYTVKEGCSCTQIVESCSALAMAFAIVPGMEAMCSQVDTCCKEGATNDSFNTCLLCAQKNGAVEAPSLSLFEGILGEGVLPTATEPDADLADLVCEEDASPGGDDAAGAQTAAANETDTTKDAGDAAGAADEADTAEDTGDTAGAADETDAAEDASPGDVDASPDAAEEPSAAHVHTAGGWMPLAGAVAAVLLS